VNAGALGASSLKKGGDLSKYHPMMITIRENAEDMPCTLGIRGLAGASGICCPRGRLNRSGAKEWVSRQQIPRKLSIARGEGVEGGGWLEEIHVCAPTCVSG